MAKTNSEISKELRAINTELHKAGTALGTGVQKQLLRLLRYSHSKEANGDVSLCSHFYNGFRKVDRETGNNRSIVRAEAIKTWLSHFVGLSFDDKTNAFKQSKAFKRIGDDFNASFKVAAATRWNEYKQEKPESVFDLDKAIAALVERAADKSGKTAHTKTGEVAHKVDTTKLDALRALLA